VSRHYQHFILYIGKPAELGRVVQIVQSTGMAVVFDAVKKPNGRVVQIVQSTGMAVVFDAVKNPNDPGV
jgi:hypothetical protein